MPDKNKSDVKAVRSYAKRLAEKGYHNIKVIKSPADLTAEKDDEVYYFEIKMTSQTKSYFGAATLTEWLQAITTPDNYFFVIAKADDSQEDFTFFEYTPAEFMKHSTIPPYKIYFNINLTGETKKRKRRSAIQLTEEIVKTLSESHKSLKNLQ